jgi:hypothetical protein
MRSWIQRLSGAWVPAAALALTTLPGCASVDWKGHRIDEVVTKLGRPASVQTKDDGRRVYTWKLERSAPLPPVYNETGDMIRPPGTIRWQGTSVFVVDEDGIVLQWRSIEQTPPPEPVVILPSGRPAGS